MKKLFSEKYKGAMLAAAIGDALGWPNEQNSNNINKHYKELNAFVEWSRKCGGRYWPYEERIYAGEYSDDTQLLIATLRSLLRGNQWGTYFRQVELPAWLEYQRGGGGATKRAAQAWTKGISPWDENNDEKLIRSYYMAGGNGVAMRIMPHVIKNEEDIEYIMKQVLLNGMYTHGHPRALVGAMLYAYSLAYIFSLETTLEYGELIEELINKKDAWGSLPKVNNIESWKEEAQRYLNIDYDILWKDCVNETVEYLKIAREGIVQGVLDIGNGVLERLCCFDKKVNGAGNVSAVIAIYLFSKYAAEPYKGLMETVNLKNTDTDTLGSMVGALFGALHGDSWIPIELRGVQDYQAFEQLIVWLLEGKKIFDEKQQYRLFSCEQVSKLTIGEIIEVLPFGKLELIEVRNEKTFSRNMYAVTFVCRTEYGQTIFATKVGRNRHEDRQKSADQMTEPSFDLRINKAVFIELGAIFSNVRSTCDFVEIVTSLMKLIEQREALSKEFIDYYKEKWKKYRITKKQMEMAYKLLMK